MSWLLREIIAVIFFLMLHLCISRIECLFSISNSCFLYVKTLSIVHLIFLLLVKHYREVRTSATMTTSNLSEKALPDNFLLLNYRTTLYIGHLKNRHAVFLSSRDHLTDVIFWYKNTSCHPYTLGPQRWTRWSNSTRISI